jgi:hypothetical protein
MDITLTYTVQKTVLIEDIPHYTLTKDEIDRRICNLLILHAPDGYEGVGSDHSFDNGEEPITKGCEPKPLQWFDIDGFGELATNSVAIVSRHCPAINNRKVYNEWKYGEHMQAAISNIFNENSCGENLHPGYFHQRFAAIKNIPGIKVYGEQGTDPGFCYVEDRFIAVIMPTQIRDKKQLNTESYFQFDSC